MKLSFAVLVMQWYIICIHILHCSHQHYLFSFKIIYSIRMNDKIVWVSVMTLTLFLNIFVRLKFYLHHRDLPNRFEIDTLKDCCRYLLLHVTHQCHFKSITYRTEAGVTSSYIYLDFSRGMEIIAVFTLWPALFINNCAHLW